MAQEDPERSVALRRLGIRLAAIRKEKGWSRPRLAAAIGVTVKSVWRWETGEQEMGVLYAAAIAKALGTTVHALLDSTAPTMIRAESLFFVSPKRIERIQGARTDRELRELVRTHPLVSIEIEPSDVQIDKQRFLDAQKEADDLFDSKLGGPLKRFLRKLRGLS